MVTQDELLDSQSPIHNEMKDLQSTLQLFREKHGFGRGIAAPQIGVNKRMIAFHCDGLNNGEPFVMLNPRITSCSQDRVFTVYDDCMSLPDIIVRVERFEEIVVEFDTWSTTERQLLAKSYKSDSREMSELIQHEVDHLDGVLMTDRAIDKTCIIYRDVFQKHPEWFRDAVDLFYEPV